VANLKSLCVNSSYRIIGARYELILLFGYSEAIKLDDNHGKWLVLDYLFEVVRINIL